MNLVTIELDVPGSSRRGRVFFTGELYGSVPLERLEAELAAAFIAPEDEARFKRIEDLLSRGATQQVAIYPGETQPPEYHMYLRDPALPEAPLFGCVLAPEAVVVSLLEEAPQILFETAIFQAMPNDTSPAALLAGVELWARRVFPDLKLPRFELFPWPVESLHVGAAAAKVERNGPARGALLSLPANDYPTAEELSA